MAYQPKSYRKFVATAATATLVASAVTPAFAAETGAAASFTDVSDRYKEAVDYLVDNKITNGVTDTQFGTEQAIKRVDAAVMIAKALEIDIADRPASGFTDVPERAVAYVDALKAEGIINGKTATTFGSDQDITRGEIALILANAYDLNGTSDKEFSDVSSRYAAAVEALVAAGITNGKTETTFGTADAIKRGEFAIFLYKAENLGKTLVEAVSATTSNTKTTVSATVKNAPANATAKVEIFAGSNTDTTAVASQNVTVVDGKVSAQFTDLPAGTHIAKVTVGESTAQTTFTVVKMTPKVDAATALNAQELKVVFNQAVAEASAKNAGNYTVKVNGEVVTGLDADNFELQADKRTVLVKLETPLLDGQTYEIDVDGVVNADFEKVEKYDGTPALFTDATAPTVSSVEAAGTDSVKVYFNEPVESFSIKVDGGTAQSFTGGTTNEEGKYFATVSGLTGANKLGNHTVVLYDVTDANDNVTTIANATYTVSNDSEKPSVTSVSAVSSYKFKVKFSEAVELETSDLTIRKGTTVIPVVSADANETGDEYTVTIAENAGERNPVYASGETNVSLSVKINGYQDVANFVGDEYNGTVVLTKDTTRPSIVSNTLNTASGSVLNVRFNEELDAEVGVDVSKLTASFDGIEQPGLISSATVVADENGDDKIVQITLNENVEEGTYAVAFAADAVQDLAGNKNAALTTTVASEINEYVVLAPVVDSESTENTIVIPYGVEMGNSALQASNYTLDGQALPTGTTVKFVGSKQEVHIVLPDDTFTKEETKKLIISSNVKTAAGKAVVENVDTKAQINADVTVFDNVEPVITSAAYLVASSSDTQTDKIKVTFSEDVTGGDANDLKVVINNEIFTVEGITAGTENNELVVDLARTVNVSQAATISLELDTTKNATTTIVDGNDNVLESSSAVANTKVTN
ncbi:S-layer homology domain-containing protein [Domibacillus sp. 8LH]|uniref:S-layer homology domain-containing protein n=1 Tax=Domibacillus sp. 8LH TaxID=3073900 RepID=UPI00316D3501